MLKLIRDFIFFIFIFSFFNDNFMVDTLGSTSLKAVFALFLFISLPEIVRSAIHSSSNAVMRSYYIFFTILSIVSLISVAFLSKITLIDAMMVLISIHVVFTYVSHYQEFDKLLYFVWASVFTSAIISLFNDPINIDTFRTSGGTADPVEFSGHLFMGIFISIYLFKKNSNYIFLIGSNLLFLYAMLYGGSKTAVLTVAILLLYSLFARFGNFLRQIFSLKGFVAIVVILGVVYQANLFDKLDAVKGMQERAKTQGTADQRFISWEAGTGMIGDYFFTGVGLNEYPNYTQKYKKDYLDVAGYDPHNIFIKVFAETGVFSFLAFLTFLFFLFKTKYFELIKSDYYWITLIPLSTILMGMALSTTYEKHFWLSIALLVNVILFYDKEKEHHV